MPWIRGWVPGPVVERNRGFEIAVVGRVSLVLLAHGAACWLSAHGRRESAREKRRSPSSSVWVGQRDGNDAALEEIRGLAQAGRSPCVRPRPFFVSCLLLLLSGRIGALPGWTIKLRSWLRSVPFRSALLQRAQRGVARFSVPVLLPGRSCGPRVPIGRWLCWLWRLVSPGPIPLPRGESGRMKVSTLRGGKAGLVGPLGKAE